jgi:hypothetical protein
MDAPIPGKKLNPRQKRLMYALGAGALLALFVLMSRRGAGGSEDGGSATDPQPAAPAGSAGAAADPGSGGSTFADNGAALGQLNTTLTGVAGQLQNVTDYLATTQPATPQQDGAVVTEDPVAAAATPAVIVNVGRSVAQKTASAKPGASTKSKTKPTHDRSTPKRPAPKKAAHKVKPKAVGVVHHTATVHGGALKKPHKTHKR